MTETIDVDLLVVGAGAGGMASGIRAQSLGLNALVIEASDQYGGSSAMSGGVCWVGNNPKISETGIPDTDGEALEYLKAITKGEIKESRLKAYLENSQRMVSWFEAETTVRFDPLVKYTDYYPEEPGGKPGGRSMESRPFDGTKLGNELQYLRRPHPQSQILGKFGITAAQAHTMLAGGWRTKLLMMWLFFRYFLRSGKRRKFGRDTDLCCGNALAGRLRHTMMEKDVDLWLNTAATELIIEDGKVCGAVVTRDEKEIRIRASKGVVLAAGGFSRNQEMRNEYQRNPIDTVWHAGNPYDTGIGIQLGLAAGGSVDLMKEAWWTPVTMVPKSELAWVLVVEKNCPGGIFVNKHGNRFCNEAAPYIDVVIDMYADNDKTGASIPAWLVFDADFRKKYPVGPIAPGYAMPDAAVPRRYRDGKFLYSAPTLAELAEKLDVPADTLQATVDRQNEFAKTGIDEDFGRGNSASDRYYGDHRITPNPNLAPIDSAPFYAIAVYPGDLGTKGGLVISDGSEVLREDGTPIAGLYACGNTTASVMGRTYPGAGGTISPAITYGMLAAETAANS